MRRSIKAVCVAILFTIASVSSATESDAYHACAAQQDAAARLVCFDRVDSARYPKALPPPSSAAAAPADPDIGLDARQARRERAQRGELDRQPAVIVASVVTVIPRSPLRSAFELSNGQIWEQVESVKFTAEPREAVTIRPGLLGAFFLKNAAGRSVRVHRLK